MDARVHGLELHLQPISLARRPQGFPPELAGIAIQHLEGDITTLRVCSLVCTSWGALTRPYLFRRVVCRPRVPSLTWEDFFQLLSTSPDVVRHIRSLTIDEGTTSSDHAVEKLAVANVREALERIPSLNRLCIKGALFKSPDPVEEYAQAVAAVGRAPPFQPRRLEVLALEACSVDGLLPVYHLLSSIAHIHKLSLYDVVMRTSASEPTGTPLPPLDLRIDAIQVDGSHGDLFWKALRRALAPGALSGVSVSTRLSGNRDIFSILPLADAVLSFCAGDAQTISINVLGRAYDLRYMVEGAAAVAPDFPPFEIFPLSVLGSIPTIVLYMTTTSVRTGRVATRMYAHLLDNNWLLLAGASTTLTNIELRFQRYGPHNPATIDDLRAINDPTAHTGRIRWSMVDEGTLTNFPNLQAFTCVLCDGGFLENYGPFESADPVAWNSGCSREQEYNDYVGFLKGVLPRLHESGLLRFRMAED